MKLSDRVEALTGPDRKVDAEIAIAVGYKTWPDSYGDGTQATVAECLRAVFGEELRCMT